MRYLRGLMGLILVSLSSLSGAQENSFTPPQLSFGVPDLQGIWSYETRTSLERPEQYAELEIDEAAMLSTLEPTDQILDDYQNFGTNRRNDAANVGGYDPAYFSIGESLALIDGKYRTSIIVDPPTGKIPWQEQAQATRRQLANAIFNFPASLGRSDGPEGRALSDRCLKAFSSSTPFLSSVYNNNMQIVQSPDHVVLVVEMVHDARIVRIDQEHRDLPFNKWLGDSIGYYEDNTLIVVTKNFNNWEIANGYGVAPSVDTVLTERFTRIADDQILYSFTIDDPNLYTQPWTGEMPMRPSEGMYEYSCHEGNHALPGILAGERRLESDAANN
ncbi:MAG: hypothetical protein DHS20C12_02320 [Pseudohongiella sp.]|nr:MAG: hypothetical protein DHS20C12_02320 [Pseudohongiella sp.]